MNNNLLAELRRGDHTSYKKLFEHYCQPLFQFSYSYLKSKEAAEDVVQEVFLKIWNNRKEIKEDTSFQAYLFTIALNSVRKNFNKLARQNELKHDILLEISGQYSDPDNLSDYQYLLDKLKELTERMPEKRRLVFIKKKQEEKSLKEIAAELEITTKTVEYHITEAMRYLKQEFKKLRIEGMIFFHLFIRGTDFK